MGCQNGQHYSHASNSDICFASVSTCDGARLPSYIPTLQEHPARHDDLIKSYFHLGLEYTEILLFNYKPWFRLAGKKKDSLFGCPIWGWCSVDILELERLCPASDIWGFWLHSFIHSFIWCLLVFGVWLQTLVLVGICPSACQDIKIF